MKLISPEYKYQNQLLHLQSSKYGISAKRYIQRIKDWLFEIDDNVVSAIDYGCGKGTLKRYLKMLKITEYDPAIPNKDKLPCPSDIVFCIDVLEHIEPKYLDNVLQSIQDLAVRGVFLTVALREGKRVLPDGRLCHLNIHPVKFWQEKFDKFFLSKRMIKMYSGQVNNKEFVFKGFWNTHD